MSDCNELTVFADLHLDALAEQVHGNCGWVYHLAHNNSEPMIVYFHEGRGWLPEDIDRRPLAGILQDAHTVIGTAE